MNRDLLEALGALAAEVYFDALGRHPGLFLITGERLLSDDDEAVMPVLICIDELVTVIHEALHPSDITALFAPEPPDSPEDDDIPF
jgi:hypothetical protein